MKIDIDRLMAEAEIDGLWVCGSTGGNPSLDYFVGAAHLENVHLFKKRGEAPILLHRALEREEATATGLRTITLAQSRLMQLLEQTSGDRIQAEALQLAEQIGALGLNGRVAIYGQIEAGWLLAVLDRLRSRLPAIEWTADGDRQGVLGLARITKDPEEVQRIRFVGQATRDVVDEIRAFLQSHRIEGERLVNRAGGELTVGKVKARIHGLLADSKAQSPGGPIFTQGRQAAIGHSVGRDADPVTASTPLIFDLYPCENGGGYFYDFTRTWCLGSASDEALALHRDVLQVYQAMFPRLKAGASTQDLQLETCQMFESLGHPTIASVPDTESGFTHSLGHGVGLAIHEPPSFRHYRTADNGTLEPGMIFAFEPGLYYPEKGLAVRLEDTIYVRPDGTAERLVDYPFDLMVPLDGA